MRYTDRRLLLINDNPPAPSMSSNATSSSGAAAYADGDPGRGLDPSSMAVTVLVFLSALLFLGFFSVYARRFLSAAAHPDGRPRPPGTPQRPLPPYAPRVGLSPSSFAPAPDPAAIRRLPLLPHGSGAGKGQAAACVVCLSEFAEKETVKAIPACGHVFHPDCIDAWLLRHGSCPLCRSTELFADLTSGSDAEEHRPAGGDRGRYRDSTRSTEENPGEVEEREGGVGEDLLSRRPTGSSDRWGCRAQTATTQMRRSHSV